MKRKLFLSSLTLILGVMVYNMVIAKAGDAEYVYVRSYTPLNVNSDSTKADSVVEITLATNDSLEVITLDSAQIELLHNPLIYSRSMQWRPKIEWEEVIVVDSTTAIDTLTAATDQ